jgi:hypothetical protein
MCPEAAKFRVAPLQDEEDLREIFDKNVVTNVLARVPPSSKVQASQPTVNIEDVDGSGCEGEDDTHVTPLHVMSRKKRTCPYSPSPSTTPRVSVESSSRLDRLINLFEKKEKNKEDEKIRKMDEDEKSKNCVTSPGRPNER